MKLKQGILLLSDPFLKDPHFVRSVVLICDYNSDGAFGLVINKKIGPVLSELLDQAEGLNLPVYEGGPVQPTALHFVHRKADLIPDGIELSKGIFWGGNFETVITLLKNKQLNPLDIRFFVGYSGWSEGQLEEELKEKSWIIAKATAELLFDTKEEMIWKKSLQSLGGEYQQMVNYPMDPQLN